MCEIGRHIASGDRYLVAVRGGVVSVAAGPLTPAQDPPTTLERPTYQRHNPQALLCLRKAPAEYTREYTTDEQGCTARVTTGRSVTLALLFRRELARLGRAARGEWTRSRRDSVRGETGVRGLAVAREDGETDRIET